jgi:hypothetical protein
MDPLADAERLAKEVAERNARTDAFNSFVAAGDAANTVQLGQALSTKEVKNN